VRVADPYIYAPALAEVAVRCCRDGAPQLARSISRIGRIARYEDGRLQRFVAVQDAGGTYDHVAAELRAGRKASHWMWLVFPQIAGLGYCRASRTYAITSLDEARA
jgi:hypothetical protein